jgi:hypothetical protein
MLGSSAEERAGRRFVDRTFVDPARNAVHSTRVVSSAA